MMNNSITVKIKGITVKNYLVLLPFLLLLNLESPLFLPPSLSFSVSSTKQFSFILKLGC